MADDYQQLSDKQIKSSYWFLMHKKQFYQALIGSLIAVNVIFWGYSTFRWISLYYVENDAYLAMMQEYPRNYVNFEGYKEKDRPRPFRILGVSSIPAGDGKYDLMAKIENPNPQWMALFQYQFIVTDPEAETKVYSDFILPGDYKYALDLGVETSSSLGTPRFNILELKWEKVRDAQGKKDQYYNIEIVDSEFQSSRSLGIGKELPVSRLAFSAENRGDYNFWKMGFAIVLFSGTRPVGVNYMTIDDFSAGEKRDLEMSWFNDLPSISNTEIKPDVNIIDFSNYREFEGATPTDVRDYTKYRRR